MKRMSASSVFIMEVSLGHMENILGLVFSGSLLNSTHMSHINFRHWNLFALDKICEIYWQEMLAGSRHKCKENGKGKIFVYTVEMRISRYLGHLPYCY